MNRHSICGASHPAGPCPRCGAAAPPTVACGGCPWQRSCGPPGCTRCGYREVPVSPWLGRALTWLRGRNRPVAAPGGSE